ncbi:helix-turn-helix domain-containing protein [Phormidium tenue FACHB-886]|nr:helix-turn-helix domain-containing protein [Phormidium tenue FACHB-886]
MLRKPIDATTIVPESKDAQTIKQLENLLDGQASQAKLVGTNGEEIPLPEAVYEILCNIVRVLSAGQSLHLIPEHGELTTQEAADYLNMSRPSLIKLLKGGKIPFSKVGAHRRIRFQDLVAYRQQQEADRRSTLREFTGFLQEEGFYDYDGGDSDC